MEKGLKTNTQIAKDFDIVINTLSTELKKADDDKQAYDTQGFRPQYTRMKKADFEDVDDGLHAWMREACAHDIPITVSILQDSA